MDVEMGMVAGLVLLLKMELALLEGLVVVLQVEVISLA